MPCAAPVQQRDDDDLRLVIIRRHRLYASVHDDALAGQSAHLLAGIGPDNMELRRGHLSVDQRQNVADEILHRFDIRRVVHDPGEEQVSGRWRIFSGCKVRRIHAVGDHLHVVDAKQGGGLRLSQLAGLDSAPDVQGQIRLGQ